MTIMLMHVCFHDGRVLYLYGKCHDIQRDAVGSLNHIVRSVKAAANKFTDSLLTYATGAPGDLVQQW